MYLNVSQLSVSGLSVTKLCFVDGGKKGRLLYQVKKPTVPSWLFHLVNVEIIFIIYYFDIGELGLELVNQMMLELALGLELVNQSSLT